MRDHDHDVDVYDEKVKYLMDKWMISREEAERLLENKRDD